MAFCVYPVRKRDANWLWFILGLASILGGSVLRFVILPRIKVVPADLSVVRTYEGTLVTMLDPQSLEVYQDLSIHIERAVRVERVVGDAALVYERAELRRRDDGRLIQSRETRYGVHRRTLQSVDGVGEDWHREGLTISFPIGTKKQDYQGWNEDAQQVETARIVGEERRDGLDTYVFNTLTGPDPIRDPYLLALLPDEIDRATLLNLIDQIPLSDQQRALVNRALPRLPDPVPLGYVYDSDLTLWVEPTTGMVVDLVKHETRRVALGPLPVATIFEMDWRHTPETVADTVAEAKPLIRQVQLFERTLPPVAWAGGLLLIVIGLARSEKRPARG